MWKWLPIIWVLTGATGIYGVVTGLNAMKEREASEIANLLSVRQWGR